MAKLVWTSDPEEARRLREQGKLEPTTDADAGKQVIRVGVDRKRRAGKAVTVASGFELAPESLSVLATRLKKRCGAGGTAKRAEIEIQGDHAEAVVTELNRLGYKVKRV